MRPMQRAYSPYFLYKEASWVQWRISRRAYLAFRRRTQQAWAASLTAVMASMHAWAASACSVRGAREAARMSRTEALMLAAWPRHGALTIKIASSTLRKSVCAQCLSDEKCFRQVLLEQINQ